MAWKGAVRALGVDLARLLVAWGTDSVKLQSVQLGSCSERAGDLADQLRQCRFDTQELNKCFSKQAYLEGWQHLFLCLVVIATLIGFGVCILVGTFCRGSPA